MTESPIRAAMADLSEDALMAIATGANPAYTPAAQDIAAHVLKERGVSLPRDLRALRAQAVEVNTLLERELDNAASQLEERAWGKRLVILGIGACLLPLAGLQFFILRPLGYAAPVVGIACAAYGIVLLRRTEVTREPGKTDE